MSVDASRKRNTPRFHRLLVSAIRQPSPHSVALSFAVPADLAEAFTFVPGQYVTLRLPEAAPANNASVLSADDDGRRSYSICSAIQTPDTIEVGIKQVEEGYFSNLAQHLKINDSLDVMTPQGNFKAEVGGSHHYLLVAAGSGITPCLSIAKSILGGEPDSRISLLFGNRTVDSIMFRGDIDALKDRYTTRFSVLHFLSAEQHDTDICNGRIDADKLAALAQAGLIDPAACDAVFCCGPLDMIESTRESMDALGVAQDKVHFELFNTGAGAESSSAKAAGRIETRACDSAESASGSRVKIVFDGSEKTITVDAKTETVLVAARKAGMDLPFSCQGGMCCTCRCKIVSGEVAMDVNFSLAQWEIDDGYALACQARPMTDELTLDFDKT